jgi:hypothetical protein
LSSDSSIGGFSNIYLNPIIMKILVGLLIAMAFIAASCNNNKQFGQTLLSNPSPYYEKLHGKVEKITEKTYWAVAEGDILNKGNIITTKERDSLHLYNDFEAKFDTSGDHIIDYNMVDENNKIISSWKFIKENNKLTSVNWTIGDSYNIQMYHTPLSGSTKYGYNDKGQIIDYVDYKANVDTVLYTWTNSYSENGDTIQGQQFDNKGVLLSKWLELFNGEEQFIGWEGYDQDGIKTGSMEIMHNENGFWSDWTNYDKDKKVTSSYTRTYPEYDANGNWVIAITKNNKGQTWLSERTYIYYQ